MSKEKLLLSTRFIDNMGKDIEVDVEWTLSVGEGDEKRILDTRNVDEALKFLEAHAGTINLEDIDERKMMRKIDWTLMPLMFLCYFLQYSDKTLINYAVGFCLQTYCTVWLTD